MPLLNWASPTPGASEVGLPHVITRPRFHLRPALKLPEQHFHFSAVVCILIIFICSLHRGPPPRASFRLHFQVSSAACIVAPRHTISTFLLSALS